MCRNETWTSSTTSTGSSAGVRSWGEERANTSQQQARSPAADASAPAPPVAAAAMAKIMICILHFQFSDFDVRFGFSCGSPISLLSLRGRSQQH